MRDDNSDVAGMGHEAVRNILRRKEYEACPSFREHLRNFLDDPFRSGFNLSERMFFSAVPAYGYNPRLITLGTRQAHECVFSENVWDAPPNMLSHVLCQTLESTSSLMFA